MKRDIRDPGLVGEKLLHSTNEVRKAYGEGIPMSEVWDLHVSQFLIQDYKDPGTSLERYGDPAKIKPYYAKVRVR